MGISYNDALELGSLGVSRYGTDVDDGSLDKTRSIASLIYRLVEAAEGRGTEDDFFRQLDFPSTTVFSGHPGITSKHNSRTVNVASVGDTYESSPYGDTTYEDEPVRGQSVDSFLEMLDAVEKKRNARKGHTSTATNPGSQMEQSGELPFFSFQEILPASKPVSPASTSTTLSSQMGRESGSQYGCTQESDPSNPSTSQQMDDIDLNENSPGVSSTVSRSNADEEHPVEDSIELVDPTGKDQSCEICSFLRPNTEIQIMVLPRDKDKDDQPRSRRLCVDIHAPIARSLIDVEDPQERMETCKAVSGLDRASSLGSRVLETGLDLTNDGLSDLQKRWDDSADARSALWRATRTYGVFGGESAVRAVQAGGYGALALVTHGGSQAKKAFRGWANGGEVSLDDRKEELYRRHSQGRG